MIHAVPIGSRLILFLVRGVVFKWLCFRRRGARLGSLRPLRCLPLEGEVMKRKIAFVVLWVSVLASCGPGPTKAPPDAVSLPATVDALVQLYREECVKQRHLKWLRGEAQRRRASCGSFMMGAGERGDCESEVEHFISWDLQAANNSTVNITLDQARDAPRIQYCLIQVSDNLGPVLQDAAFRIAQSDRRFLHPPRHYIIGPLNDIKEEGWVWASFPHASEAFPHLKINRSKVAGQNGQRWSLRWLTDGTLLLPPE